MRNRRGNKNEGDDVKDHLFLMKYKVLVHVLLHGLIMREDGLQAHLQVSVLLTHAI